MLKVTHVCMYMLLLAKVIDQAKIEENRKESF